MKVCTEPGAWCVEMAEALRETEQNLAAIRDLWMAFTREGSMMQYPDFRTQLDDLLGIDRADAP